MAVVAAFVIAPAMATVTAGRINFSLYLVDCHVVAAVWHFPVGTVTVFDGWLHFRVVGVAVSAKRDLVT